MADSAKTLGAVVVAAGSGRRFGTDDGPPKQFREVRGVPIIAWSVHPFLTHPRIASTVLVLPERYVEDPPEWLARLPCRRVAGGAERGDSVRRGLRALGPGFDRVLIHDGARPLVTHELIDKVIAASVTTAAIPGLSVTDTLKVVDDGGFVLETPDRERFRQVQTPQVFPMATLLEVHERAYREGWLGTDDAVLFERYGHPVRIVEGDPVNLKVTTTLDLAIVELLAQRLPLPG